MILSSRPDVVEALESAGWTGVAEDPNEKLRHPSGAAWAFLPDGRCGLVCPNGVIVEIPWGTPDSVVIAACLAAADQLQPTPADMPCEKCKHPQRGHGEDVCGAEILVQGIVFFCGCPSDNTQPQPAPEASVVAPTETRVPVRVSRTAMAAYKVPALSRIEVDKEARTNPRPEDCPQCQAGSAVGHWPSSLCVSAFARGAFNADRLLRVHCTCDRCF
ncbi:hypothetical protein ACPCSP_20165 [Streptomyces cinereoruber]|uniref:hypothetical protein n=1 Tax=Streptomyces cinereoruber TaxID=67260 RepID=UPI003C2CE152